MPDDHLAYLQVCGENADQDIEVGRLAIALFSADHQGISVNRYHTHLKKIFDEVSERHAALIEQGSDNDVYTQLAAMKHVLSDLYGYAADTPHHEVLESADLMRVIDRGKGCSSALCLLYMDVARKMGWRIEGLNFPSRFLCRLEMNGLRLIVLYARIKQENEAIKCLNEYIERAPLQDRNEALQLLNALQSDQS